MKIAQQGSEQVTRSPMTHGGFIIHKKPRGREAEPESWDELQNMSPGEVRIFFGRKANI